MVYPLNSVAGLGTVAAEGIKQAAPIKKEDTKLIYPKSDGTGYGPMTRADWEKELQRLADDVDKANEAVEKDLPTETKTGSEDYERPDDNYASGAWVEYWKKKEEDPNYELPSIIAARDAREK